MRWTRPRRTVEHAGPLLALAMLALTAACGEDDQGSPADAARAADLRQRDGGRRDGEPADSRPNLDRRRPDSAPRIDITPTPDTAPPPGPFTVILLPDTQYYAQYSSLFSHFTAQTQWIAKNLASRRIVFVSHVGDIVDNGAKYKVEWTRADQAMKILDGDLKKKPEGLVPYGAVAGNHDYDTPGSKKAATQYLAHFGPTRYQGRSWFVGASANKMNMAQIFMANGQPYLHLALEYRPSDSAIGWAQQVLRKRPAMPVIMSTHAYLTQPAARYTSGGTSDGSGDNSAEGLYRKLVEPFPQIFLVLCGHKKGTAELTSTSALGQVTHQLLVDYQFDNNGGNGFLQLLEFRPIQKKLVSSAISPTYKAGVTAGPDHAKLAKSNYTLTFDHIGHRTFLQTAKIGRFRQGQDLGAGAYKGTQDTYIGDGKDGTSLPTKSFGAAKDVWCDGNQDHEQGLIRFDTIIGNGKGQVPAGAKIKKAILSLTTEGSYADSKGGARFHRMKVAWSEASTWTSLSSGISLGAEAESKHDADSAGMVTAKGTRSFDVTASVQAWANGAANHGWVLINKSTDRWTFRSSEWPEVVERPLLTVLY